MVVRSWCKDCSTSSCQIINCFHYCCSFFLSSGNLLLHPWELGILLHWSKVPVVSELADFITLSKPPMVTYMQNWTVVIAEVAEWWLWQKCTFSNDWMQGINIGFYSSFLISETSFALFAKSIYPLFGYPWHTLAESKVVSIFNAFIKIQMLWYFRKKCSPLAVNTMTIHKYFPWPVWLIKCSVKRGVAEIQISLLKTMQLWTTEYYLWLQFDMTNLKETWW